MKKFVTLFAIVLVIFTNTLHFAFAATFSDDFNDNQLDTSKWEMLGGPGSEQGGVLNIYHQNTPTWVTLTSKNSFGGDFECRMEWKNWTFSGYIGPFQNPPQDVVQIGWQIHPVNNPNNAFIYQFRGWFPVDTYEDRYVSNYFSNGVNQGRGIFPKTTSNDINGFLGIKRVGSTIRTYYSDIDYEDFAKWNLHGEFYDAFTDPVRLMLRGYTGDHTNSFHAEWDNISVVADTVSLPSQYPITVSGTITDSQGNAISGARVEQKGNLEVSALSDNNGNFKLESIPWGTNNFSLKIIKNNYVTEYSFTRKTNTSSYTFPVSFVLMTDQDIAPWKIQTGRSAIVGIAIDTTNQESAAGAVIGCTNDIRKNPTVENCPYKIKYYDGNNYYGESSTYHNGMFIIMDVVPGDTVRVKPVNFGGGENSTRIFEIPYDGINFAGFPLQKTYYLTLNQIGTGTGSLSTESGPIHLGTTNYIAYSNVKLTANPGPGSIFSGWSGGSCAGTAPCTVTMNGEKSATAKFDRMSPEVLIIEIINTVYAFNLPKPVENSYIANLKKVPAFIKEGKINVAINQLDATINKINTDMQKGIILETNGKMLIYMIELLIEELNTK